MSAGTEAKIRVWHPVRDAYHCAFRIIRLFEGWSKEAIEFERLRILDMVILFPSLLHRVKMPQEMRHDFRLLNITKPENLFESIPSNAAIFRDLGVFQRTAVSYLAARGIVQQDQLKRGLVSCELDNIPSELRAAAGAKNTEQKEFMLFLLTEFARLPLTGNEGLFKRCALPGEHVLA